MTIHLHTISIQSDMCVPKSSNINDDPSKELPARIRKFRKVEPKGSEVYLVLDLENFLTF